MLNNIEIKGFKSIKEMTLNLKALNILIGPNGVGKSNFISLFNMINKIIEQKLQIFVGQSGGVDSLLYYGQKTTSELSVKLSFESNIYQFSLVPTLDNTLIFSEEVCFYQAPGYSKPYDEKLGTGHKETRLYEESKIKPKKVASHVLDTIKNWKVYHFHDTSTTAKMKQDADVDDNSIFRPDAANLASYLFFLRQKHSQNYKNIIDTIHMVYPFFNDFVLRHNPLNNRLIKLEWQEKDSDAYFNTHSFSDGTLRFICLVTLLMQPHLPSTILLDEPELGLHPYAITLLANLLKSAAAKTQVIVSTQSVTLVNQFKPEDIIVVDRNEKERQSTFKHLKEEDTKSWIEEYGLGDLWEKNIIGGRP
ncbi:MAG: chromosome segregation protein SMC [Elusimicrobia bacterium RIFOXYD2_FULL_34_15]|nr:MAG: chromosome segregation protein SMC [Elusimicrobia bacterium RIFOXYD2_FULL_34_15]